MILLQIIVTLFLILQEAHDIAARELAEKERQKEEERRAQKVEQLENLLEGKGYNNKSNRTCAGESEKSGTTSKVNKTKSNFRSGKLLLIQYTVAM